MLGLDEAFRRAELYLKTGADGIFIESPHDVAELELIGRKFDVPQMANMLEGGRTPILTPAELADMGFEIAIYGISLLMHTVRTMQDVLAKLAQGRRELHRQGRRLRGIQVDRRLRGLGEDRGPLSPIVSGSPRQPADHHSSAAGQHHVESILSSPLEVIRVRPAYTEN